MKKIRIENQKCKNEKKSISFATKKNAKKMKKKENEKKKKNEKNNKRQSKM